MSGGRNDKSGFPLPALANQSLQGFNTFRVGGPADWMVWPRTPDELRKLILHLVHRNLPYVVIGRGSNLLVSDSGYRGVVIVLAHNLADFKCENHVLRAWAGSPLPLLARKTGNLGWSGLEFAAGIPGSVGGGVRMNAGTGDGDIGSILREVVTLDESGDWHTYAGRDIPFSYRKSIFQSNREIVMEAAFSLREDRPQAVQERIRSNLEYRNRTQPLAVPSAGSVFKNPPGCSAGRLLDTANCKGMRNGGAEVSLLHANWIVNTGGATTGQIYTLIQSMKRRVFDRHGIRLELELVFLGDDFEASHSDSPG